ncbi:MAG: hypothetical protein ACR2I0_11360 [Rhodoferax sp.]
MSILSRMANPIRTMTPLQTAAHTTEAPGLSRQYISPQELAERWGRSHTAISLASAVGVGPRYIKRDGALHYPMDEVQRYERACRLV